MSKVSLTPRQRLAITIQGLEDATPTRTERDGTIRYELQDDENDGQITVITIKPSGSVTSSGEGMNV